MKISLGVVALLTVLTGLPMHVAQAEDNAEMFSRLDVNADGYISATEAEAHADLPDAFADGDMNDDGQLDLAEFRSLEISDE
jgi:Ca2+-binding EF-hand superfamily protein